MTERTPTITLRSDQSLLLSISSHLSKISRHQLTKNHVRYMAFHSSNYINILFSIFIDQKPIENRRLLYT